jgi:hypothetical protein
MLLLISNRIFCPHNTAAPIETYEKGSDRVGSWDMVPERYQACRSPLRLFGDLAPAQPGRDRRWHRIAEAFAVGTRHLVWPREFRGVTFQQPTPF